MFVIFKKSLSSSSFFFFKLLHLVFALFVYLLDFLLKIFLVKSISEQDCYREMKNTIERERRENEKRKNIFDEEVMNNLIEKISLIKLIILKGVV